MVPLATSVLVPLVLLMETFASPRTASASAALLLPRLVSLMPLGSCRLTVLVTVPFNALMDAVTVKSTVVFTGSVGIAKPMPSIPAIVEEARHAECE